MVKENKTEKYIGEYLKKHYPRRRQITVGSAASAVLAMIAREAKDFWTFYNEFKDWDFNPFPQVSVYKQIVGKKYYSRSQLRGGVSSLERGGYIKWNKTTQTVSLTEKGIFEVLKYKMKSKGLEKMWDGKWRIITFDIKEETRGDRDYLRKQLKWIGFRELQKSVWVFPYEIREELQEFVHLCKFKFQGDVRFMLVDAIEPDDGLRKAFNLI